MELDDQARVSAADQAWDQCVDRRSDTTDPAAEWNALAATLATIADGPANPTVSRYLRLLRGIALIEGGTAADQGLALLAPVVDDLAADPHAADWISDHRLVMGSVTLAQTLTRTGDLDRAVTVLRRAIRLYSSEPDTRIWMAMALATLLQQRWQARALADDRAAATADLQDAVAVCEAARDEGDPWLLGIQGELLILLAEDTGLARHARTAAGLLDRAAHQAQDDPDAWALWQAAARANRLLARDPQALETAAAHLDRALRYAVIPDDDRLQLHAERVMTGQSLAQHGRHTAPPGAVTLRAAVEAGVRALDTAGPGDPGRRAAVALTLALGTIAAAADETGTLDVARANRLLDHAATHPENDPAWRTLINNGRGQIAHYLGNLDPARGAEGGMRHFAQAYGGLDDQGTDLALRLRMTLALAGQGTSSSTGYRRAAEAARLHGFVPEQSPTDEQISRSVPVGDTDRQVIGAYSRVMGLMQSGDVAGAGRAAAELLPALEKLGLTGADLAMLTMLRAVIGVGDPRNSPPVIIPAVSEMAGVAPHLRTATAMTAASAALGQAGARNDQAMMRRATARIEDLIVETAPDDRRSLLAGAMLAAQAHLELAQRWPGNLAHASRAAHWFADSMARAGGVGFPLWPRLAIGRAQALRLTATPDGQSPRLTATPDGQSPRLTGTLDGQSPRLTGTLDLRATRELGMSALQGHAWQVFAQAGTDHSILSARTAAADARLVATWCLADSRHDLTAVEQLVATLDAGRGLVLRAATTSRSTADRLDRAGHPELAQEWRETAGLGRDLITGLAMPAAGQPAASAPGTAAPGTAAPNTSASGIEVPDDLRLRVLRALGGDGVSGFEPITTAEIRTALHATRTHALVYLVPGENDRPGYAVLIPADGDPAIIPLPSLLPGPGSPLAAYRGARTRDLAAAGPAPSPETGLDDLCAWAWDAAMGPLLRTLPTPRPARLVLIPLGTLGLIPWHAAFDQKQTPRRYAVGEAIISYSPSARSFCTTATTERPAPITSALVVGNPTGDLHFAGREALAIRSTFYPAAAYYGRAADQAHAAGTPDDVLRWITDHPAGPAALHLACHGSIDPRTPADAHLLLAGPAKLSVRTLLETSQRAALNVQEVFLAACTTSAGGDDHDEVLSLATSFLAAGARTVVGSLWPVPDHDTSLLMFQVHHYLRAERRTPAEALHAAQLWMLNPNRSTADIPADLLRDYRPGTPFPLTSWAGFVHSGR